MTTPSDYHIHQRLNLTPAPPSPPSLPPPPFCPPGGYFDPLNLAGGDDPERAFRLKTAEIKHGRLAMVAFLGEWQRQRPLHAACGAAGGLLAACGWWLQLPPYACSMRLVGGLLGSVRRGADRCTGFAGGAAQEGWCSGVAVLQAVQGLLANVGSMPGMLQALGLPIIYATSWNCMLPPVV